MFENNSSSSLDAMESGVLNKAAFYLNYPRELSTWTLQEQSRPLDAPPSYKSAISTPKQSQVNPAINISGSFELTIGGLTSSAVQNFSVTSTNCPVKASDSDSKNACDGPSNSRMSPFWSSKLAQCVVDIPSRDPEQEVINMNPYRILTDQDLPYRLILNNMKSPIDCPGKNNLVLSSNGNPTDSQVLKEPLANKVLHPKVQSSFGMSSTIPALNHDFKTDVTDITVESSTVNTLPGKSSYSPTKHLESSINRVTNSASTPKSNVPPSPEDDEFQEVCIQNDSHESTQDLSKEDKTFLLLSKVAEGLRSRHSRTRGNSKDVLRKDNFENERYAFDTCETTPLQKVTGDDYPHEAEKKRMRRMSAAAKKRLTIGACILLTLVLALCQVVPPSFLPPMVVVVTIAGYLVCAFLSDRRLSEASRV